MTNRDRMPRTLKDAFGPYAQLHTDDDKPLLPRWVFPLAIAIGYIVAFYVMATTPAHAETASWYGPGFHGRKTASGERFDQHARTAAHKTLPFGTLLAVTHKGKTIVVRVNDRGPFVHGREIDLSAAAAREIGLRGVGIVSINQIGG